MLGHLTDTCQILNEILAQKHISWHLAIYPFIINMLYFHNITDRI